MKRKAPTATLTERPRRRGPPSVATTAASRATAPAELGVCQWFHYHDHTAVRRAVKYLRELGVRHLRTGVSWADFYRPDGPAWYDWVFEQLAEFDLLISVWHTPPSIGEIPACNAPPQRLEEYAEVLERIIDRYGRYFEHLELWNEPNNLYKWDFRRFDPDWSKFANMVRPAARLARRRGKATILGGMSPVDPGWIRRIERHGGLDDIDVVAIHGFPHMWWDDAPCWDRPERWRGWADRVRRVERVIGSRGLWVTESGLATWDPTEQRPGRHALQVRMLEQAAEAPLKRIYWYALIDLDPARQAIEGFHVDENEYHLGLVRHDGTRKRAFHRMRELIAARRAAAAPPSPS